MIKYCPNCTSKQLTVPNDAGQGIKSCEECGAVFYMLETTKPSKDVTRLVWLLRYYDWWDHDSVDWIFDSQKEAEDALPEIARKYYNISTKKFSLLNVNRMEHVSTIYTDGNKRVFTITFQLMS